MKESPDASGLFHVRACTCGERSIAASIEAIEKRGKNRHRFQTFARKVKELELLVLPLDNQTSERRCHALDDVVLGSR